MERINQKNLNTQEYWDKNIAEPDFGLRQRKYLELAGKGKRIVELGCGMSPFLDKARKNFDICVGIDFSPKTLKQAQQKYPEVLYIYGNATETPLLDKSFDVVVAGELIEHLFYPNELLTEMKRIAKRKMILSTANMEYNDKEHLWKFEEKDFVGES